MQSIIMKFVRLAQPNQISTRKTGANSTIFWLSVTNSITNHTKFSGLKQQLFHFAKPYIIWILCGPHHWYWLARVGDSLHDGSSTWRQFVVAASWELCWGSQPGAFLCSSPNGPHQGTVQASSYKVVPFQR